jgi:hypothetical protein
MDYPQASAVASIFAQHAMRFGNRLQVLPWDAFGNLFKGPDDTWGTISMTALAKEGSWNYWKSLEPTAEYYGIYMTYMDFLENGYAVLPVESSTSDVAAYAIGKGDSARVMIVNLSDAPQVVQIDRASVKGDSKEVGKGDLVRTQVEIFGEDQFKWVGTSQNAYPYPKMGPSGRRINPSKSKDVTVPPFGLAVVQINPQVTSGEAAAEPKVLAAALEKKVLLAGDSLDLFGTVVQENGQLIGSVLSIPELGISKVITPDDGKWNASIESFHVKVPFPANVKLGSATAVLKISGLGKKSTVFKIPFRIRGAYRTTSVMQNFDNGLDAVDWFPVANGDNATTIGAKVFNGAPPHGGFIRHDFMIEQPPTQGWPNFAGAYYVIPEEVHNSVGIVFDYATNHSNPDGYFEVQIASEQVKDYDEFMVRLKNTRGSWVRDTLIWENMTQEGWGKTIPQLDPKQIKNFSWRARYSGTGYISLDNIYLLQEDGTEVPMPRGLRRLR